MMLNKYQSGIEEMQKCEESIRSVVRMTGGIYLGVSRGRKQPGKRARWSTVCPREGQIRSLDKVRFNSDRERRGTWNQRSLDRHKSWKLKLPSGLSHLVLFSSWLRLLIQKPPLERTEFPLLSQSRTNVIYFPTFRSRSFYKMHKFHFSMPVWRPIINAIVVVNSTGCSVILSPAVRRYYPFKTNCVDCQGSSSLRGSLASPQTFPLECFQRRTIKKKH